MRRAVKHFPSGDWPQEEEAGSVTLRFEDRHRRRLRMSDDQGAAFLLDLADATQLADGDGLGLEDGGIIRVCAAAEAVLDITCANPLEAARVAWHIGNRHTPLQVLTESRLRIGDDHVIREMVRGLGVTSEPTVAPFTPESGAYRHGD